MQSERFIVNVQGRSSRVHVKWNLSTSDVSPFDTDDFTAIAPWMWRWREETRVIPGLCEFELCAGPTGPPKHVPTRRLGAVPQYRFRTDK